MATFPRSEPEIVALAQAVKTGLEENAEAYPTPPVDPVNLDVRIQTFLQTKDTATAAQASAQQAIAEKNDALQDLTDDLKSNLRYAENAVKYDDTQLKLLGWGGRKEHTAQQAPGQARSLEAPRQGEGWVFLDWKKPASGGSINAYKIQRRPAGTEPWTDVGIALETETTLVSQERGVSLEYRVIALNKVGPGDPSNTIAATL